jgi:hypothetical protein
MPPRSARSGLSAELLSQGAAVWSAAGPVPGLRCEPLCVDTRLQLVDLLGGLSVAADLGFASSAGGGDAILSDRHVACAAAGAGRRGGRRHLLHSATDARRLTHTRSRCRSSEHQSPTRSPHGPDPGGLRRRPDPGGERSQPARCRRSKGAVVSLANCSPFTPVTKRPPRIRPRASSRRRAHRISRHGTASRSWR